MSFKRVKDYEKLTNKKSGLNKAGGYLASESSIVKQTKLLTVSNW